MAKDKDIEKPSRQVAPRYSDPFGTLRSEMDRLFDTFMGGLPTFPSMFGPGGARGFALTPSLDVKETDQEIVVESPSGARSKLPRGVSCLRRGRLLSSFASDLASACRGRSAHRRATPRCQFVPPTSPRRQRGAPP
jgi:hypothetical protein